MHQNKGGANVEAGHILWRVVGRRHTRAAVARLPAARAYSGEIYAFLIAVAFLVLRVFIGVRAYAWR